MTPKENDTLCAYDQRTDSRLFFSIRNNARMKKEKNVKAFLKA